ncbi:MAG: aspartate aminotransferase family protein [Acidimicrobiales bacterium]
MPTRADEARDALVARTPRSRSIAERSHEVLNMGSAASLEMPHPVFIAASDGARVFDADGNAYIDCQLGFGTHVLGHRHPAVVEALHAAVDRGFQFGIHNPDQERLASMVCEAVPGAEGVIFCNSGSEATFYAIRAARAFTGRDVVATFDGAYHGAHDWGMLVVDPDSPADAPVGVPMSAGVPAGVFDSRMILPYRRRAAFDLIRAHADELALVMIEPVQSSNPRLDDDTAEWLRELRDVCRQCGVLFLMDEVITGFRIAWGGMAEHLDLAPDLVTHGKALGGGVPIGGVAGRADVMRLFRGASSGDPRAVFSGGSFSGNPLSMAAGVALVGTLGDQRAEVYPYINAQGERLVARLNRFAVEHDMAFQALGAGSMFQLYFQREPIASVRDMSHVDRVAERDFYLHLLANGVLVPGTRRSFLSAAHTPADVDAIADAIEASLLAVREDGRL